MQSITFINLPSPFIEDPKWIYPLGILQIAAFTRGLGHPVELLDLAGCSEQEVAERVHAIQTDCIGVSAVTPQYPALARIPLLTNKRMIAGGIHPTLFPAETLAMGYDAVVVGEGEPNIETAMRADGVFRSDVIVGIDHLPLVDRTVFSGYNGPAPVMAGRGCPFKCSFCAQIDGWSRTRFRSIAGIVNEVDHITNPDIIFYDDTFTLNKVWLTHLCEGMLGLKNGRKHFRCSTRSDRMTDEVAQMLRDAGCVEVCLGVESGSQRILDGIKKNTTVECNSNAVKVCKRHGLRCKAFIMLGLPGESDVSIADTSKWISHNAPDKIGLYMFNPLPGSDIYEHPENYDLEFTKGDFCSSYYGGQRNEMRCRVSTSHLYPHEIEQRYHAFLQDFKEMLI